MGLDMGYMGSKHHAARFVGCKNSWTSASRTINLVFSGRVHYDAIQPHNESERDTVKVDERERGEGRIRGSSERCSWKKTSLGRLRLNLRGQVVRCYKRFYKPYAGNLTNREFWQAGRKQGAFNLFWTNQVKVRLLFPACLGQVIYTQPLI